MATAEAETSHDESVPQGGSVYDGFISYSHAADDLLAPRLQAGLQRFAKPWWKRRAVRIFRDESSLSANPHLWSSITDALDQSGWFVLLLSPDAAESPWVNNEVEYWLEHKDPDRIIPVLTDGEFGWHDGDVTGDAFPAALAGAFADEPRWVDLRFARTEEQLDLKNPTFSAAIADIASPIRGVPKDELESEEVRQHRRTARTAWGAALVVVALAIAAGGAALFANAQRQEANEQRVAAEESAAAEAQARLDADAATESEREARELADQNALEAEQQAGVAKSRELGASSVNILAKDPELSILLALESIHKTPPSVQASPAGVIALRQAMGQNRLLARYPTEAARTIGRISGDGSTIYYAEDGLEDLPTRVIAVDADSHTELWVYAPQTDDNFVDLKLSPDERLLSVAVLNSDAGDELGGRVELLDASTGDVLRVLTPGPCVVAQTAGTGLGFSPDGQWFAVFTGTEDCFIDPSADWIAVFDTATWEEEVRVQLEGVSFETLSFSGDSSRVLVNNPQGTRVDGGMTELRSFPDLELINLLPDSRAAGLSPDGQLAALVVDTFGGGVDFRPLLVHAETGDRIAYLDAVDAFPGGEAILFSPDQSMISVTTRADDYVFETTTGKQLVHLGNHGETLAQSFTDNGSMLLTSTDFNLQLWNITEPEGESGTPIEVDGVSGDWINPNRVIDGPNLAVKAWVGEPERTIVLNPETGATIASITGDSAQLADGRFVVAQHTIGETDASFGPLVVWDPSSGSVTELSPCVALASDIAQGEDVECAPHFGDGGNRVMSNIEGTVVAAQSYEPIGAGSRTVRVWDGATLEVRSEFEIPVAEAIDAVGTSWFITNEFGSPWLLVYDIDTGEEVARLDSQIAVKAATPDGTVLFTILFGRITAFDTTSWEPIRTWDAHDAFLRGAAVSPDGTRLVTTGEDNLVKVWDLMGLRDPNVDLESPPPLFDRIRADFPSDAAWLDDNHLAVFLAPGARYVEVTLSIDELVARALRRLTRGFTIGECASFEIEVCPTLEDIRGR